MKRRPYKQQAGYMGKWLTGIAMIVLLISAGCGGGGRGDPIPNYAYKGVIHGVVLDGTGEGVQGARVAIINTPIQTTTNSKGEYRLFNVPNGNWPIVASKPGYRPEGYRLATPESGSQDNVESWTMDVVSSYAERLVAVMYTYVHIRDGKTMQAPDLRIIEYEGQADDVDVVQMETSVYSDVSVGEEIIVFLDIAYELQSSPEGVVIATVSSDGKLFEVDYEEVTVGKDSVPLSFNFTVPNVPSLMLQVSLMDEYGLLSTTSRPLFRISGYDPPRPPKLEVGPVDSTSIVLSWSVTDPDNLAALKIYRSEVKEELLDPVGLEPIAVLTDGSVSQYIDQWFHVGQTLYYTTAMETVDGRRVTGREDDIIEVRTLLQAPRVIYTANLWLHRMLFHAGQEHLIIIDFLDKVMRMSTRNEMVVDTYQLPCRPMNPALSKDGSMLYFRCAFSNEVGALSFVNGFVYMRTPPALEINLMAYDPEENWMYVAGQDAESDQFVLRMHPTRAEVKRLPVDASRGLALWPDERFLMTIDSENIWDVSFYDLKTMERKHTVTVPRGSQVHSMSNAHFDGTFAYVGDMMLTYPPHLDWYGTRPGGFQDPFDVSGDGRVWTNRHEKRAVMIAIWNGYAWSRRAEFSFENDVVDVQLNANGSVLYIATNRHVFAVDINEYVK